MKIPNTSITLQAGESYTFTALEINLNNLVIELPGNSDFDFVQSKYTKANYGFTFTNISLKKRDGTPLASNQSRIHERDIDYGLQPAESTPPTYWLTTIIRNMKTQYNENNGSCLFGGSSMTGSGGKYKQDVLLNGALFTCPDKYGESSAPFFAFRTSQISPTCGSGSFNGNVTSLPIEVIDTDSN